MATCIHCGERFEGGSSGERPVCLNCRSSFAFPPTKTAPTPAAATEPDPEFDAYYTWLGIPPAKQPPNHYRLLGLTHLEDNLDVIETAAERQSTFLRAYLDGPQVRDAERLLAEVEAARTCLLNEHTKSAYDQVLGQVAPTSTPAHAATAPSQPVPVLARANAPSPDLMSEPAANSVDHSSAAPTAATPIRQRRARPKRSPVLQLVQIVVGGVIGCAIGYYLGFVLIPSIRARNANSETPPPPELIIRQSPRNSSNRNSTRRPVVNSNSPQQSTNATRTDRAAVIPKQAATSNSATRTPAESPAAANHPQSPSSPTTRPALPRSSPTSAPSGSATRSRGLSDLAPSSRSVASAAPFPATAVLPKRGSLLAETLFSIPSGSEFRSPRLLTDAAHLQADEYLFLDETEEPGVRSWTVSAAIPGAAGDDSRREIGEFIERAGEFSFRWFSRATVEDESRLLNSMIELEGSPSQPTIALREPRKVPSLQFDMDARRSTQSFGVGAIPRQEQMMLELGDLSAFPSRARYDGHSRNLAIGESTVVAFDDVPGAELEIKFQGVGEEGLTIAITPRFRENSASVVPMTKSQLQTTLRSVEKTIVRTQADIRDGNASLSRLRSQSTSRLTGAQAAGLAGLINKTQSRVNSDERKLVSLQAKLSNGPKIRNLLDALHQHPMLAFRITAAAGSGAKLTLVDGEWP